MRIASLSARLSVILLAAAATPAIAADWVRFFTTADGAVAYYDRDAVTRTNDSVRVSVKIELSKPADDVVQYIGVQDIDCAAGTRSTLSVHVRRVDGSESTVRGDGTAQQISPDTTASAIRDIVCRSGGAG